MISPLQRVRNTLQVADQSQIFGIRTDLIEQFIKSLREDLRAQIGFTVVVLFAVSAIFAPIFAPHPANAQIGPILKPPTITGQFPLGTDSYGRGMLSRLMYGARVSLAVGLGAVTIAAIIGIVMGTVAAYYGGWIDDLLMRTVDIMWAFPWLVVAILLVSMLGQGIWNVIAAVAFAYIDDFARLARGEILSIREEQYTLAAESVGLGDIQIMFEEMFPNMIAPLIVQYTIFVAQAIIVESSLSFLGLGVKPTTPTWGSILGQGRGYIRTAWWISTLPGLAILVTVLGINLFGDALRDAFDVREETGL